jgi:phospholipid transport system substrate-binding protein
MPRKTRRSRSRSVKLAACAAWLALLSAASPAEPQVSAPVALVSATMDEAIAILNDKKLSREDRLSRLEDIARRRFDFVAMSRLVVASHWKRFSPEQQRELVGEFEAFLARTYGERIDRYTNEKVEVVGEQAQGRYVKVLTKIVGGEYGGAEVNYRLLEAGGAWRVVDVEVEGISLVLNYRDQFKAVLARGGPEGLLEALRKKNAEGAVAEG